MGLEDEKRSLRERMRSLRGAIDGERARAAAQAAALRLQATPEYARAARIALYAAVGSELGTHPLFDAVRAGRRTALLPRADTRDRRLRFVAVDAWDALLRGPYGVPEPPDGPPADLDAGDLVVVPGLAFDRGGQRLGSGQGFYDRTFAPDRAGGPILVGYAFDAQLVDAVPHAASDRRMDLVVTERDTHRSPAGRRE